MKDINNVYSNENLLDNLEEYAMYLRKSRADIEAEANGEGETLARHENILLDLARKNEIKIGKIYKVRIEELNGEDYFGRVEE